MLRIELPYFVPDRDGGDDDDVDDDDGVLGLQPCLFVIIKI